MGAILHPFAQPRQTRHVTRDGVACTGRNSRGQASCNMPDSMWDDHAILMGMLMAGGPIDAPHWLSSGSSTVAHETIATIMVHQRSVGRE